MNHKVFFLLVGIAISFLSLQNAYAVTIYPGVHIANSHTNYTANVSPNFNVTSLSVDATHIYLGNRYFDLNSSSGQMNANITRFFENNNATFDITIPHANTHLFVKGPVYKVLLGGVNQPYGSTWFFSISSGGFTNIDVGAFHNIVVIFNSTAPINPAVNDLYYTCATNDKVFLKWGTPPLPGITLLGYQINYTTPTGIPLSVLVPNTFSALTNYTVTGLSPNTQYSFRVGTIDTNGNVYVNGANIASVTTVAGVSTCNSGSINLNVGTNPNVAPYRFYRHDITPSDIDLFVSYPSILNTTCNFNYEFLLRNDTFTNLTTTPNGTGRVKALFEFNGTNSEIINTYCHDFSKNATGRYVITLNNIPLVDQIHQFQAGQFGTSGLFGSIDIVELMIIIIAMIGLNRVNETIGVIIMFIVITALAFFHIGTWQTIVSGAAALAILVAVITTKKLAYS